MKFQDRVKSYKFWVALSASLIILLRTLGEAFGFTISEKIVDGIIMGFCSVLVVLGIVEYPVDKNKDDKGNIENKDDKENIGNNVEQKSKAESNKLEVKKNEYKSENKSK